MGLEIIRKFPNGMHYGQHCFFQRKIARLNLLQGFANIVDGPLNSVLLPD